MHFYAWKKGLKTGMYYLRTQAATQAVQFTVEKQVNNDIAPVIPQNDKPAAPANDMDDITAEEYSGPMCTMQDGCITCSS